MATDSEVTPPQSLDDPALYLNRELSWIEFNERVLAEARDVRNPLLERVKFLAITAANLDEFYSKRVAWLKQAIRANPLHTTVDGLTVSDQSRQIAARCTRMRRDIEDCWHLLLQPALSREGIDVVPFKSLDTFTRDRMTGYFMTAVYPVLTPLVVDSAHPFPFISGGSLSLALTVRDPRTGAERFARVKVPQNRPRFVDTGDGSRFVMLEDLISSHLHVLFPGVEVVDAMLMRVLRSIELGTSDESSDDVLEMIEREVQRRRLAEAVGLETTRRPSPVRMELLLGELRLTGDDMVITGGPLGLSDLLQLSALNRPELAFEPFTPALPQAFADPTPYALFPVLQTNDILVHHPYESFDATVARFVDESARDPAVLAIKQTLYRTSSDSPLLRSLIDASMRGKQVAVLVELTARMDEENNIEWARRLEDAGVHVAYGNPAQKIHSKICLVVREEPDGVRMYAHIGTGNYNARTARVYTDLGLFTADPAICADLLRVFNYLTGLSEHLQMSQLLVAPENLRSELEWRVQREIEAARAGRPARVIFKMNALEDYEFTRLLYEAAAAGVQVDLIVRGLCRLRPGLPSLSEHVRVVSVIGRFLEHSRVFCFENEGHPEYFIGSADIMKRNLDERIEVITPIHDPAIAARIRAMLDLMLSDTRQQWVMHDSTWTRDEASTDPGVHATLLAQAPFS